MLTSSERLLKLPDGVDLHARPAAVFTRTALAHESKITVGAGEKEADAKSLLSLLALGAKGGSVLRLRAEGKDAEAALDALGAALDAFK